MFSRKLRARHHAVGAFDAMNLADALIDGEAQQQPPYIVRCFYALLRHTGDHKARISLQEGHPMQYDIIGGLQQAAQS